MKFITILSGLAALTCSVLAGDCENGPFQKGRYGVGAGSGIARCETRWDEGLVINAIEVWYEGKGKSWIRGIQFQYSNGDLSEVLGNTDGTSHRLEWDAAKERIEKVTLWGDGKGKSVGRIKIRTTNQDMEVGKDVDGQTAYDQPVGSGVFLGIYGFTSWKVDMLQFLFIGSKIKSMEVSDVKFDKDPKEFVADNTGLYKHTLDEDTYTNNRSETETEHTFKNDRSVSSSRKIISSIAHTFGTNIKFKFEASIPLLAKQGIELDFKYEMQKISATEDMTTDTRTISWSNTYKIKPGETVYCKAYATVGTFDSDYVSTMTLTLEDGRKYSFKDKGRLESVQWSNAYSSCQDVTKNKEPGLQRRVGRGLLGVRAE